MNSTHLSLIPLALIIGFAGWRCLWLSTGVPDTTELADIARVQVMKSAEYTEIVETRANHRISFAAYERGDSTPGLPMLVLPTGIDVWDDRLPVWITPGQDAAPGWATWDDNGNGVVDDESELGAAWSDDFCIVQLPHEPAPAGRIIDHGGYRGSVQSDVTDNTSRVLIRANAVQSP